MVELTISDIISAILFCEFDENKNVSRVVIQDKQKLFGEYFYRHEYPISKKEFGNLITSKQSKTIPYLYKTLYVFRLLSK